MTSKILVRARGYILAGAGIILFWHVLALLVHSPMLPPPQEAFAATLRLLGRDLGSHLQVSAFRVILSTVLSLLIGFPLGLIMGFEAKLDKILAPVVYLIYPVPKIVFLPLILFFLGLGDISKVFLITFIVFFQILVTTRDAVKKVPFEMIDSLRSLGGNRFQIYRHVLIPASLPDVLTALRVSMGTAIAVLFFAESFATSQGLGYFIMDAWSRSAQDEMFAGIIVMGALGTVLFIVLDMLESVVCRWQKIRRQ
ncbi:binding-protein-dependent transport systems inner membrane component [Syntrophobotulus glycolicus DSM 8271]|uniref:Binding-protein-dependent transport systems inner membrane component n=1 Tax=Syntrophobotulus glycolicus (strain DSM 8271 / FlGlyR) TaxID=645991 RepID=F0T046_SYNGF|nr:ABC transporter permease [Syntrophobotulus glycolicus]ADY56133.1 binding-protein-dependent transport systems inner membrane component [Syntrophobotulus glycolicus DSM 8271]